MEVKVKYFLSLINETYISAYIIIFYICAIPSDKSGIK